jgi:hypothetical protein
MNKRKTYGADRDRVATQVCTQWAGDDYNDENLIDAIAAADMAFTADINDLDWEAATLARLSSQSPLK